jgi:GNAT superfamily N-acetyltransferase
MSWRLARPSDDAAIVTRSLALYAEDPSEQPVDEARVRRTLAALRAEPLRGRAVVLELDGAVAGYALLVAFWSNEYGGELCEIDELYVDAAHRGQGHGSRLFDLVQDGTLWPGTPVALGLEITDGNARARRLYERLGFKAKNRVMRRL